MSGDGSALFAFQSWVQTWRRTRGELPTRCKLTRCAHDALAADLMAIANLDPAHLMQLSEVIGVRIEVRNEH